MNNDLISREALKKAFEDTVCIEPMPYAFVKQIIDNAPTVEQRDNFDLGYIQGLEDGKNERPQGEWLYIDNEWGTFQCDKCKKHSSINYYFCPNCGADMRGDKE